LDNTSVTLDKGTTAVVNVKASIGEFKAIATDPNVDEVTVKGYEIKLRALAVGQTSVVVKDAKDNLGIILITVK